MSRKQTNKSNSNKKKTVNNKMTATKETTANTTRKTAGKVRLKPQFLEALELSVGNISEACRSVKISRSTYYDWFEKDPAFTESVDEIKESLIDLVESKLMENIKKGNVAAQIFFLKTKGKDRGYDESLIESNNEKVIKKLTELAKLVIKRDCEAD